ncbi:hypothetical protein BC833DRAFT_611835 [Globomyces pollinis-pini]|nr:hypothetical protein BC833DRAFT_611835 [Globomyces pollinis-pini]
MFKMFVIAVSKEANLTPVAKESMKKAHARLGLTNTDFNKMIRIMGKVLSDIGATETVVDEFLKKADGYRSLIVQSSDSKHSSSKVENSSNSNPATIQGSGRSNKNGLSL